MKNILIFVLVFAFFAGGGILFSLHKENVLFASQTPTPAIKKDNGIHIVSLLKDKAEPDALAIKVGEAVQFNSKDGRSHEISSGTGDAYGNDHGHEMGGAESGLFGADEAYKVQFKKPGTYEFHDNKNPKIFITVVVYEPKTHQD